MNKDELANDAKTHLIYLCKRCKLIAEILCNEIAQNVLQLPIALQNLEESGGGDGCNISSVWKILHASKALL